MDPRTLETLIFLRKNKQWRPSDEEVQAAYLQARKGPGVPPPTTLSAEEQAGDSVARGPDLAAPHTAPEEEDIAFMVLETEATGAAVPAENVTEDEFEQYVVALVSEAQTSALPGGQ